MLGNPSMIDFQTRAGTPVRVRRVLPADLEHEARETWEETYTICRPFVLAKEAEGLEGIPGGCPVVYIAHVRLVRLEDVEKRAGIYFLPSEETWGPFFPRGPKWQRMIERAGHETAELFRKLRRRDNDDGSA